jgi:hypothetical protein
LRGRRGAGELITTETQWSTEIHRGGNGIERLKSNTKSLLL